MAAQKQPPRVTIHDTIICCGNERSKNKNRSVSLFFTNVYCGLAFIILLYNEKLVKSEIIPKILVGGFQKELFFAKEIIHTAARSLNKK
jgi:hypothetical protein